MSQPGNSYAGPAYAPAPYPVRDTESLRRAALQASWQRDRSVGRRRLAWRWALWLATCFGLPLALGGVLLALTLLPHPGAATPAPHDTASVATPAQAADPLALRLESDWTPGKAATATAAPRRTADKIPLILQPDDWLHSKEP